MFMKPQTTKESTHKFVHVKHEHEIKALSIIKPNMDNGPWIVGGAPLSWYHNRQIERGDIDVWCSSLQQFSEVEKRIRAAQYSVWHTSDNAVTYGYQNFPLIQIIRKMWFQNIEEIFAKFDLTVCAIASDGNTFKFGEGTVRDINQKVLRLIGGVSPSLPKRLVKYIAYGFTPSPELLEAIDTHRDQLQWNFENEYEYNI